MRQEVAMSKQRMAILAGLVLWCGLMLGGAPWMFHAAPVLAAAAPVSELKVTIKEWDVPTKGAHPHDPAVAPDGSLWFTEQLQNKLGRLDPATGDFKEYPLKGKN